jgi:hypothetical protein
VAHGIDPASYADFGIGDHNECRNPTSDALPWCYVDRDADVGISVPDRRRDEPIWGYCGVVDCFAMDDVPPHSPRVEAQCSVVGEMTVSAWTSAQNILAEATPRGKASDEDCADAAVDDLHVGADVRLFENILVRTAMTADTAAPYVRAVAFEAVTGSAALVLYANMTFAVDGVVTSLPYAGTTDAAPVVTAFAQTAFSATGVSSKAATATWIDGTVVTVVATECAACADAYRLDVNVKVPAADGVAVADAACGGAGGDIANAVVTCVDDATPWFAACPTAITSSDAEGYCTTARAALALEAPTDASIAVGTAACRQCARVGRRVRRGPGGVVRRAGCHVGGRGGRPLRGHLPREVRERAPLRARGDTGRVGVGVGRRGHLRGERRGVARHRRRLRLDGVVVPVDGGVPARGGGGAGVRRGGVRRRRRGALHRGDVPGRRRVQQDAGHPVSASRLHRGQSRVAVPEPGGPVPRRGGRRRGRRRLRALRVQAQTSRTRRSCASARATPRSPASWRYTPRTTSPSRRRR